MGLTMSDNSAELLETVRKIYGLLELLADEKIEERDKKQRMSLREIVGTSAGKQKSIFLMDGIRTQKQIYAAAGIDQSDCSKMVSKLHAAKLLTGDTKNPKLVISIPSNFFEAHAKAK
jgi:hypothetical protein